MDTHLIRLLLALFSAHLGQNSFVIEAKAWGGYEFPDYGPFLAGHPTIPQHTPYWVLWNGAHADNGGPSGRLLFPSKTNSIKTSLSTSVSQKQEGKWITGFDQIGGQRFYNYSYIKETINKTDTNENFEMNKTVWVKRRKRDLKLAVLPMGPFNEKN